MFVWLCTRVCVCVYVCTPEYACVCVSVCAHECTCACVCMYACVNSTCHGVWVDVRRQLAGVCSLLPRCAPTTTLDGAQIITLVTPLSHTEPSWQPLTTFCQSLESPREATGCIFQRFIYLNSTYNLRTFIDFMNLEQELSLKLFHSSYRGYIIFILFSILGKTFKHQMPLDLLDQSQKCVKN